MSDFLRFSHRPAVWLALLSAGALVLVLLAGGLIKLAGEGRPADSTVTGEHSAGQRLSNGATFAGAGGGAAADTAAGLAQPVGGPVAVRFTFDAGPGRELRDIYGTAALRAQTAAGGLLEFERHGSGWAAEFPARCRDSAKRCPRAILASGGDPNALNPGRRPLEFGASLRMSPRDTAPGANVVQKGYSVGGGSQFKLQVDGAAGRPSCVIASTSRIYRVIAPVRVADGRWHRIGCRRAGNLLSMSVDGVARGSRRLPDSLSIVNSAPLRIGGKGINPDNDQFAGQVDDVYVVIN